MIDDYELPPPDAAAPPPNRWRARHCRPRGRALGHFWRAMPGQLSRVPKRKAAVVERRIGKLPGRNTRAAGLFEARAAPRADGFIDFTWNKKEAWRTWAESSEGCYLLHSNVTDWTPEELWRAYIQLTEAEAAGVAPKAGARGGAYSGLLPVLRSVEDPGPVLLPGLIGIGAAKGL